jgi:hypothetical protein
MSTAADGPRLPPEVARLGTPEQVFDLSAGPLSMKRLCSAVLSGICALPSFGLAFGMLLWGIAPQGEGAAPPVVYFIGAAIFGGGGLWLVYSAYLYAWGGRRASGSYYLFRDLLAVVGPDWSIRQIAWEQIGPEKALPPSDERRVFPVDGEADLAFNRACADHEALATAIVQRVVPARWKRIATQAGVSRLPGGRRVPAFLVHDPADTTLYRVSALAGRLLFIPAGYGCAAGTRGFAAPSRPVQGGLVGGLVSVMQTGQVDRLQQALDILEAADERRLFELAYDFKGSRLIAPDELSELHVAQPTSWEKMSTGVSIVAVLKFKHADWGEKKLYFESRQQLDEATLLLKELQSRGSGGDLARVAMRV